MDRRNRDRSRGGEDLVWWQQGGTSETAAAEEWEVPHTCICRKIGRDALGESDPSPRPDQAAQDSSTRKIKPYNF